MAYTHVSRLTTTSGSAFETLEAWLEAHGNCGQLSEGHTSWNAVLDEGGTSITRTVVWPMKAVRDTERSLRPSSVKFKAIVVSESED
tara:strand:- start:582 stop:842 length:261 start_codon:yes stop_codon:yes gene_type:complete